MRKLRDGLEHVGLPSEDLLRHGNSRVVYSIPIAENFREILLGVDAKPKYFLSLANAKDQPGSWERSGGSVGWRNEITLTRNVGRG